MVERKKENKCFRRNKGRKKQEDLKWFDERRKRVAKREAKMGERKEGERKARKKQEDKKEITFILRRT